FHRPPVKERTIGSTHPIRGGTLQERHEAGKVCFSVISSRGVRVHLDSLNPGAETKLVLAPHELQVIRAGEEISRVVKPSRNADAARSDCIHRGTGCSPDCEASRRSAFK